MGKKKTPSDTVRYLSPRSWFFITYCYGGHYKLLKLEEVTCTKPFSCFLVSAIVRILVQTSQTLSVVFLLGCTSCLIGIMMSFSHTTGEEQSGVVCPNPCKKGFLVPLQEDLAPALMAEIQMEGPFFCASAGWKWEAEQEEEAAGAVLYLVPSLVGSYLQYCLCSPNLGEHLEPAQLCVCLRSLCGAVEEKARVGNMPKQTKQ